MTLLFVVFVILYEVKQRLYNLNHYAHWKVDKSLSVNALLKVELKPSGLKNILNAK